MNNLVELLRRRADEKPESLVYTFLQNGETEDAQLTYGELDRRARCLAGHLAPHGVEGEPIPLLYPPSLDFIVGFFGCLYAGAIPVPLPEHRRRLPKIESATRSSGAWLGLTKSAYEPRIRALLAENPETRNLQLIASDTLPDGSGAEWKFPKLPDGDLAYLQYTSGSIGESKGVMIRHSHLLHNFAVQQKALRPSAESVMVTWLPAFHDLGLIYGLLLPIYNDFPCYQMAPAAFVMKPRRWLQALSKYRGTHTAGPNFAYDLCCRRFQPEHYEDLDLSRWQVTVNGAEPVRWETQRQFAKTFAPYGFRSQTFCPAYGLAESTLFVSTSGNGEEPRAFEADGAALEQGRLEPAGPASERVKSLVSCGPTYVDTEVAIVDPQTGKLSAPDTIGEIWLASASVGAGYWNRPEATAETFQARLAENGAGPFLRTGDLGVVQGGELLITGRLKDLIIIGGFNHYPQDVEFTVEEAHPAIRPSRSAAFSIEGEVGEELVVVAEARARWNGGPTDFEELRRNVLAAVSAEHQLQVRDVVFVKSGSIPKTSSGKAQRKRCRALYLARELEYLEKN